MRFSLDILIFSLDNIALYVALFRKINFRTKLYLHAQLVYDFNLLLVYKEDFSQVIVNYSNAQIVHAAGGFLKYD